MEYGFSNKFESLVELVYRATEDCLNFAEQNEIDIVELVLEPPEVLYSERKNDFIDLIRSYSLSKQVHGPFIDVNLCSHNPIISDASVASCTDAAQFCPKIDVKVLTIHPGLANFLINSIRDKNKFQLARAFNKLQDRLNPIQISVCLENMPQNCFIMSNENDIEKTFSIINNKDLFFTYDTSHFYTCDGDVKSLWEKFHKIIKNVHVVDNSSKTSDEHPPLGSGKVNFREIFEIIKSYDYKGALIIELSTAKDLTKSIEFIKKFL
ncbi:MAG: sugar phosphate isomerase/epimerase family protein [Promethearchaeota archaeon]